MADALKVAYRVRRCWSVPSKGDEKVEQRRVSKRKLRRATRQLMAEVEAEHLEADEHSFDHMSIGGRMQDTYDQAMWAAWIPGHSYEVPA